MADTDEILKIVDELRAALKSRTADADGSSGIAGLSRTFAVLDRDRSGQLDLAEFARGVSQCKLGIDAERVAKLHGAFDRDGSGLISYDEFIRAVRGTMPPKRLAVWRTAALTSWWGYRRAMRAPELAWALFAKPHAEDPAQAIAFRRLASLRRRLQLAPFLHRALERDWQTLVKNAANQLIGFR